MTIDECIAKTNAAIDEIAEQATDKFVADLRRFGASEDEIDEALALGHEMLAASREENLRTLRSKLTSWLMHECQDLQ